MADAAASLAKPAANAAYRQVRDRILSQVEGHYKEEDIKCSLLSVLEQIKDDTDALRQANFKTAYQQMKSWNDSPEKKDAPANLARLKSAADNAKLAFNLVKDPADKIITVSLLIFAEYHSFSFTSERGEDGEPNWKSGKLEAQQLLRQYANDMPQLMTAAREENRGSSITSRVLRRDKDKRRRLLRDYCNLSAAVFALHPQNENNTHPRFSDLHNAVLRACDKDSALMLPGRICHITSQPRMRHTLKGHTESVRCLSIFANDTRVVSGSMDDTLKVWDFNTGEVVHTLKGHTRGVLCVSVFANDTRVVSGSGESTLKVWDLSTGEVVHTLEGHTNLVYCVSVFANDTRVVSGSYDDTLKVWDLNTGEVVHTLEGHTDSVYCVSVFAIDTRVVSGSRDETLKVWDLDTGEVVHTLEGHTWWVNCVSVFANDTRVISGSWDNTLKVWEIPMTSNHMPLQLAQAPDAESIDESS